MRNSLKQMLRTPMRTALFFLLLTARLPSSDPGGSALYPEPAGGRPV